MPARYPAHCVPLRIPTPHLQPKAAKYEEIKAPQSLWAG